MSKRVVTSEYVSGNLKILNEACGTNLSLAKVDKKNVLKDGEASISRVLPIWMVIPYAEAYATGKMAREGKPMNTHFEWPWDRALEKAEPTV